MYVNVYSVFPSQARGQEGKTAVDVLPECGRLAMFFADEVPHEVRPTGWPRHAGTGWYYDVCVYTHTNTHTHTCRTQVRPTGSQRHAVTVWYYDETQRKQAVSSAVSGNRMCSLNIDIWHCDETQRKQAVSSAVSGNRMCSLNIDIWHCDETQRKQAVSSAVSGRITHTHTHTHTYTHQAQMIQQIRLVPTQRQGSRQLPSSTKSLPPLCCPQQRCLHGRYIPSVYMFIRIYIIHMCTYYTYVK
jgi:hypothetical protein